jgi:hypothetical protein
VVQAISARKDTLELIVVMPAIGTESRAFREPLPEQLASFLHDTRRILCSHHHCSDVRAEAQQLREMSRRLRAHARCIGRCISAGARPEA